MIGPLLIANFVLGMGIWPARNRQMFFSVCYSILCLVGFCVLTRASITYLEAYYSNKVNDFDNLTFHAIIYSNICLTMCLIVTGWWRVKVSSPKRWNFRKIGRSNAICFDTGSDLVKLRGSRY